MDTNFPRNNYKCCRFLVSIVCKCFNVQLRYCSLLFYFCFFLFTEDLFLLFYNRTKLLLENNRKPSAVIKIEPDKKEINKDSFYHS